MLGDPVSLGGTHLATAGTSIAHTISGPVPARSMALVSFYVGTGVKVLTSVTDDQGNTYTAIQKPSTNLWIAYCYVPNGLPSNTVITALWNGSGSTSLRGMNALYFTGRAAVDQSLYVNSLTGTAWSTSASPATTQKLDVSIGSCVAIGSRTNDATAGTPTHTEVVEGAATWALVLVAASNVPSGTAVNPSGTWSASVVWHSLGVVFKDLEPSGGLGMLI